MTRSITLPTDVTQAETMLETTIALLDKMTAVDGIASEGYRQRLRILKRYQRFFQDQNAIDGTFLTKFLHTINHVQQLYFKFMLKFVNKKYPLLEARPTMECFIVNQINDLCSQIDKGIIQTSPLPSSLLNYRKSRQPSEDQDNLSDQEKTDDKPSGASLRAGNSSNSSTPTPLTNAQTYPVSPRFDFITPKSRTTVCLYILPRCRPLPGPLRTCLYPRPQDDCSHKSPMCQRLHNGLQELSTFLWEWYLQTAW